MASDSVDYCSIPLQAPPPGQTSNLVDPFSLSVTTVVLASILTPLSLIFLLGRLIVHWKVLRTPGYLAIAGFILSTGYTGAVIGLRKFGRHAWDVPYCWYLSESAWTTLFASNILLGPTQFIVKTAILTLYFQLFAVNKVTKRVIIAAIVFSGLIYLPHPIFVIVFEAPHIGETWLSPAVITRSADLRYYAPVHGIGSIILDIWILVLPMPIIFNLKMSPKKRLQLLAVFITGSLGVISSIFSCYWRFHMVLDSPGDSTWQQGQLLLWIMVEHNVALIVGCMPATVAFFKAHVAGAFSSLRSRIIYKGSSSGGGISGKNSELSGPSKMKIHSSGRGGQRAHPRPYYQLGESVTNPSTNVIADEVFHREPMAYDDNQGILKTMNVTQEYSHYEMNELGNGRSNQRYPE